MKQKIYVILGAMVLSAAALFASGRGESSSPETSSARFSQDTRQLAVGLPVRSPSADGDGTYRLDMDSAVVLALANNLQLRSADVDVATVRRNLDHAANVFLPEVRVSGTMNRWNKEQETMDLSAIGIPPQPLPRWGISTELEMSLNLNLALYNGIMDLRYKYEQGLVNRQEAERQLERDVRKNFNTLLLMEENLNLMERNINTARSRFEQAQINYRNGLVSELAMLSARVAYENLKPALAEMELGYRSALSGFRMILGLPRDSKVELTGKIAFETVSLDLEELISRYLLDRPDIYGLVKTIDVLDNTLRGNRLRVYTPTMVLGWSIDPAFQKDPWKDSWLDGDNWAQGRGMFRLTVAMGLDGILPFSKTQIGLKELEDAIKKTRIGLAQAIMGAEMEVENIVMKLEKSKNGVETLTLNVELAERAYRMAEEAYRAGTMELLEVQNSENELRKAQLEVLREKYNYATGLLDLEYALNTSIDRTGR